MLAKLFGVLSLTAVFSAPVFANDLQFEPANDEKTIVIRVDNQSHYVVYRLWLYQSGTTVLGDDLLGDYMIEEDGSLNLTMNHLSSCYVDAAAQLTHSSDGDHAYYVYGTGINICADTYIGVTDSNIF